MELLMDIIDVKNSKNKMKEFKELIKEIKPLFPIILIYLILALVSIDKVLIKEREIYKKYNGQVGTVVWVNGEIGGIRLPDGTYGEVNLGNYPYKKGDKFINDISYGWVMGFHGVGSFVLPDNTPGIGWQMIYVFLVLLPVIILGFYLLIVVPIKWWINRTST